MKVRAKFFGALSLSVLMVALCIFQIQCTNMQEHKKSNEMTREEMIARGKYLVTVVGCNDCHTPKIFTALGPVPDTTKLLSGYPANSPLPQMDTAAIHPGYWYLASPDLMAWVGPWGISYTANITPDSSTGISAWTEENFVGAIRTGKHLGMKGGRDILPPMPWNWMALMTDDDLKSIYQYLRTIPRISNQVPAPVSPPDVIKLSSEKKT